MFSDFLIVCSVFLFVVGLEYFFFFLKNCVLARGYFVLYLRSSCPHFAGAVAFFLLISLIVRVLEVSAIITSG